MERLTAAIARRFEGARLEVRDAGLDATVPHDGGWFRARLEMAPVARIAVAIAPIDGFELALRWSDRWIGEMPSRPASFDDSYFVETNDLALAHIWLDGPSRDTLLASRYVSRRAELGATAELVRDGAWLHEVARNEVVARRRDAEPSPERMADLLAASLVVASRPVRWAAAFAQLAKRLGGEASSRVELGGRPAIRALRGNLEVLVSLVRRLAPDEPGRLRTVVAAHRPGDGARLALVRDGMPRDAMRPSNDSIGALMLDAEAARLLDRAGPSAAAVHAQEVEIVFDGALLDHDRLAAAIELAARWSAASLTPYR